MQTNVNEDRCTKNDSTYSSTVVELSTREGRGVVGQETRDLGGLVVRKVEEVAESTAAENNLLACALWVVDSGAGVDLRSTDRGDEGAGHREVRAKLLSGLGRLA